MILFTEVQDSTILWVQMEHLCLHLHPPFPQYSIDQASPIVPYSYNNNYNYGQVPQQQNLSNPEPRALIPPDNRNMLTEEEKMELFGIQNNCIQVIRDYVNGGYACDDFD